MYIYTTCLAPSLFYTHMGQVQNLPYVARTLLEIQSSTQPQIKKQFFGDILNFLGKMMAHGSF